MDSRQVEAIEDGKIVKVNEDYAKREGLIILRKDNVIREEKSTEVPFEGKMALDDFRRPLNRGNDQVSSELVDNFHWHILRERRRLNLTRSQFAQALGEDEEVVKMVENGLLPAKDFILINKIQKFLRLNLRKDQQDFVQPMRRLVDKKIEEKIQENLSSNDSRIDRDSSEVLGSDIELVED